MSTHRRAWQKRAGVVVALIVGALLTVPATPAHAATVNVVPGSVTVNAGSDATVTVQVTPGEGDTSAEINVTGLPPGVSCARGCGSIQLNGPLPRTQLLTLRANDNARNASTGVTVQVQPDSSDPATANLQLTVRGEQAPPTAAPTTQAPQTVRSISGKVVNQASEGVPNALVLLKDSAGKQYETRSDGNGNFRFSGSRDRPIAPGRIDLGASAESQTAVVNFTANAGQSITGRRITLPIGASASPTPTPTATESAPPTEDPFEDEFAEEEETPGESAVAQAPAGNEDSGGGFGNWLLILLGGLFVAVGVGTIVLLWMKRKENEEAEADGDDPAGAPAGAVPASRGSFAGADDQTRVVNRVGSAPDPTMVGGAGLSNAPTMMHQPVVDDVPPDPYGLPPQSYGAPGGPGQGGGWSGGGYGEEPGGYGAPGYGNAPSSGSGYGNSPSSGSGYGGPAYGAHSGGADYPPAGSADYPPAGSADYPPAGGGGYGERYDEPTGRYTGDQTQYPAPADPYATGMYEPGAGQGYGQAEPTGGYGRGEATGGYGRGEAGGGYGQGDGTRAYGPGEPAGYGSGDQTRGYESAGYGQGDPTRAGYGPGEPAGGGYGQSEPAGGYGASGGGYGQEPAQQRGGYDNAGYDETNRYAGQGGYGQGSGYGQEPPQQRGGYDDAYQQGGGYGQGGYGQEPPQQRGGYDNSHYGDPAQAGRGRPDGPPSDRGDRRLDWLDD
ncbi:hypothetical protein GCM10011608_29740 [Micromonospora sonchi]|uniref:Carboxypeptidase regulatory-like domain-containing protein n=1 Tax=Micromonospora sonchi TaxID=1763543 RepID=A0A917TXL2_9ACTN|nr:carboxypeptidase-like regulatory domain-containing protein [Micromonospora sonchi]GGM43081.1 hypothetical protein GCM10011608_29740 [Micromonospora sonchi]